MMRSSTGSAWSFPIRYYSVPRRTHRGLTMHRMRAWIDLALMSLTFFLTIIWNVEIGIAVSVVISLLLVVHRSSRTRLTILVSALSFPPHCRPSAVFALARG